MTPDAKMLRDIRRMMKLTQKQMATALGFKQKVRISEFERETNPVPVPPHILNAVMDLGWDWWAIMHPIERKARPWNRRPVRRRPAQGGQS